MPDSVDAVFRYDFNSPYAYLAAERVDVSPDAAAAAAALA
jgi:2-hydroxychromene-2-carboxylate isomerase